MIELIPAAMGHGAQGTNRNQENMMSTFVETADGYVNLDHIIRITFSKDRGAVLLDTKGEYHRSGMLRVEDIFNVIVASPPGYYVLKYWGEHEGEPNVSKMPVIAWQKNEFNSMTPILVEAISPDEATYILCPDGQIFLPAEMEFENYDAWLKYMAEQKQEAAA